MLALGSLVIAFMIVSKLDIRTNLTELLPDDSQSVNELNRYLERMGGVGKLIVVVEGSDVEANQRFVDDLGRKLEKDNSDLIKYVEYKSAM